MRYSKEDIINEDDELLAVLECVKEIRIPIKESDEYLVVTDKGEILKYIYKLSFGDQKELIDEAETIMYNNIINYEIDKVQCPSCHETFEKLPISMSNVLFYSIYTEV